MVPVRKPGRPLSQCPHPRDQACGCGTVTAAIPRKQTCGCGNNAVDSTSSSPQTIPESLPQTVTHSLPQLTNITPIEAPSPTRTSFKIQKSRPQSSRKQSFDPTTFERMDMNSINILPFDHRQQVAQMAMPNGYVMAGYPQMYGYMPQYANMQTQVGNYPMPPPPLPYGSDGMISHTGHMNGYSNGVIHNGLEQVVETPTMISKPEITKKTSNGVSSCCQPKPIAEIPKPTPIVTNGGSCCGPKKNGHSHSSSSSSSSNNVPEEPESDSEPIQSSCCAPRPSQQTPKQKSVSTNGTPLMQSQMLLQNGMAYNAGVYQHYVQNPGPTIFTYPPTYGSFQNPLQPDAWRESMRTSNYGQQSLLPQIGPLPYDTPLVPPTMDTIHSCGCGDTCSCIGCAAHPYNDETKQYIRSAWESMKDHTNETYTNGHQHTDISAASGTNGDFVTSPTANTPSSTHSGNGEEQSLPAADFFFVSYPFTGEGCGGDTQSCPCGDDCQCLG